jgi:hypothetical protein
MPHRYLDGNSAMAVLQRRPPVKIRLTVVKRLPISSVCLCNGQYLAHDACTDSHRVNTREMSHGTVN